MNIGVVCYPTFGGSGVVATELGIEMSKKGHEIHFIAYNQPVRLDLLAENVHYHEVNVPEYPLFHYQPYELALSSKLVDMVKLFKIDVLHVHYAIPHAYAAYMAKKMLSDQGIHIPVVTTLHGTDITLVGSHPFYKPAVEFSINHSDVVTSVSESLKADTMRLFNIKKDIEVVTNFIDMKKYDHAAESPCQRHVLADNSEKIITHVSNFRPVKRISDVVQIFNKIQKEIPAKLIMVGDGPEKEAAEQLVDSLGITDKVLFLGRSNEVDSILCYSDLFLLPSETESFGLAALEAMASSVAVISSNTGGIPEVNIEDVSGYLKNVGDVDGMAEKAIYILEDDNRLAEFKHNARERAKKFDLETIVSQYEDLYTKRNPKLMKLATLLFLILINMSCNSTKNKTDKNVETTVNTELKKQQQTNRKRMLVTLVNAQTGGFEKPQIRVVKDQEGLQEIYGQINKTRKPGFTMPKVDFTQQTIVGIFMGEKKSGGYHVEIQTVQVKDDQLILKVKEDEPKAGEMVTTVMTQPFCVTIINNADKEFVFEKI